MTSGFAGIMVETLLWLLNSTTDLARRPSFAGDDEFSTIATWGLEWQHVSAIKGPRGLSHSRCSVASSHDDERGKCLTSFYLRLAVRQRNCGCVTILWLQMTGAKLPFWPRSLPFGHGPRPLVLESLTSLASSPRCVLPKPCRPFSNLVMFFDPWVKTLENWISHQNAVLPCRLSTHH